MADETKDNASQGEGYPDIVACTGCPTGIAHTFMAKAGLEQAAKDKGLTIKVETHGAEGVKNALTPDEIKNAKAVVVAADVNVDADRFKGKPQAMAGVTAGIKNPGGLIDSALAQAASQADEGQYPDIVAATGCPTGIAHTFMAKQGLEDAAKEKGLSIKVETHGAEGVKDRLTPEEIRHAKAVVVAADVNVDPERFKGKRLVTAGVTAGIKDPGGLIDSALAQKIEEPAENAAAGINPDGSESFAMESKNFEQDGIGQKIYKQLMNGVSHMLPFVVAGGVLTAISFLWGITSFDSTTADYNGFAALLKVIGGTCMNLMVPVLSAYIAESIGGRPALVPGFLAGMISINGLPVLPSTGLVDANGAGVGFGFLGGIIGGFLSGYVIVFLEWALKKLPASLNGLKAIFLYPVLSALIVGLVMLGISGPMVVINHAMMNFLGGLEKSGPLVLGIAIGCMCAFDLGGPVNKAAYVTGTMLLGAGLEAGVGTAAYNTGTAFMAAVLSACMVPPLVTFIATFFGKKYFTQDDRNAGLVNLILGCTMISEGAIPFMTKNIWPVMPIMMVSSSIAAVITLFTGVQVPAPHGGFLVLPVATNPVWWILAILIGAVFGGCMFLLFKRYQYNKDVKEGRIQEN